jgi:hypothetical protein
MVFEQTAGALFPELEGHQRMLLIGGGAGLAVAAIGGAFNPTRFFQSYLMAYMFCLGGTLGCMALGMVHQLSGGAWGVVLRRPIGAAMRVLPIMTALFIPIVFGMGRLYPWTHADVVAREEILQHKHLYLNTPFFIVRAAFYFLVWNLISYFLNAWSLEQDSTGESRLSRRMQKLSAGGLLAYGLTITFASFDWLMSLDPEWYSTIYGVLIIGGQGLTAIAFLVVVISWLSRREPLDQLIVPGHFHDAGNLMLAFVMLWAYFAFSQYLIIWAGNLPHEIAWYQNRLQTGWRGVGVLLVVLHFMVPFLVLLSRRVKRHGWLLEKVAIGILIVRLVDLFWLIAPEFHAHGVSVSWLDILVPLSMSAFWLGCYIRQLRGRAILPVFDPEFEETMGPIIQRAGNQPGTV